MLFSRIHGMRRNKNSRKCSGYKILPCTTFQCFSVWSLRLSLSPLLSVCPTSLVSWRSSFAPTSPPIALRMICEAGASSILCASAPPPLSTCGHNGSRTLHSTSYHGVLSFMTTGSRRRFAGCAQPRVSTISPRCGLTHHASTRRAAWSFPKPSTLCMRGTVMPQFATYTFRMFLHLAITVVQDPRSVTAGGSREGGHSRSSLHREFSCSSLRTGRR